MTRAFPIVKRGLFLPPCRTHKQKTETLPRGLEHLFEVHYHHTTAEPGGTKCERRAAIADYHETHLRLFNAITDAIGVLTDTSGKLAAVQQEVEDMVLDAPEDNTLELHPKNDGQND